MLVIKSSFYLVGVAITNVTHIAHSLVYCKSEPHAIECYYGIIEPYLKNSFSGFGIKIDDGKSATFVGCAVQKLPGSIAITVLGDIAVPFIEDPLTECQDAYEQLISNGTAFITLTLKLEKAGKHMCALWTPDGEQVLSETFEIFDIISSKLSSIIF